MAELKFSNVEAKEAFIDIYNRKLTDKFFEYCKDVLKVTNISGFTDAVNKLNDGKDDFKFTKPNATRIAQFLSVEDNLLNLKAYKILENNIIDEDSDQELLSNFVGEYVAYYASDNTENKVEKGQINIIKHEQSNTYYYKSYTGNYNIKTDQPKHYGPVFYMCGKMYFSGFGPDFMRPIIFDIGLTAGGGTGSDEKSFLNPIQELIHGIVLSVTNESARVFARRICLASKSTNLSNTSDHDIKKLLDSETDGSTIMLSRNSPKLNNSRKS